MHTQVRECVHYQVQNKREGGQKHNFKLFNDKSIVLLGYPIAPFRNVAQLSRLRYCHTSAILLLHLGYAIEIRLGYVRTNHISPLHNNVIYRDVTLQLYSVTVIGSNVAQLDLNSVAEV